MRVYPPETSVAEKFETLVKRGIENSRMKDFYDLKVLFDKEDNYYFKKVKTAQGIAEAR